MLFHKPDEYLLPSKATKILPTPGQYKEFLPKSQHNTPNFQTEFTQTSPDPGRKMYKYSDLLKQHPLDEPPKRFLRD